MSFWNIVQCRLECQPQPWGAMAPELSLLLGASLAQCRVSLGGYPAWAQGKPVPRPDAAGLGCWTGAGVKERKWSGAWLCGMSTSQNAEGGKNSAEELGSRCRPWRQVALYGCFCPQEGTSNFQNNLNGNLLIPIWEEYLRLFCLIKLVLKRATSFAWKDMMLFKITVRGM